MERQKPSAMRPAASFLAEGMFALLAAVVFAAPFALSPLASGNDVYMNNGALMLLLGFVGIVCLACGVILSLVALGLRRTGGIAARGLALALVGAVVIAGAYALFGSRYESYPPGVISWPLYANGALFFVTLAVGAVVAAVAWLWAARVGGG